MDIRALLKRYSEQWRYLVVGVGTTLINYVAYFAFVYMGAHYAFANVVAWILAVTFSYFANGAWVYRSTSRRGLKEAAAFALSRLFSLGLETVMLFVMVECLGAGKILAKLLAAVVVVVVNYLTGLLVYKRR